MSIILSPVREDLNVERISEKPAAAADMYEEANRLVTFTVIASDGTGFQHEERAFVTQRESGEYVVVLDNDTMTEYEEWEEFSTFDAAMRTAYDLLKDLKTVHVEEFFAEEE